jgi:hypothetical protein
MILSENLKDLVPYWTTLDTETIQKYREEVRKLALKHQDEAAAAGARAQREIDQLVRIDAELERRAKCSAELLRASLAMQDYTGKGRIL